MESTEYLGWRARSTWDGEHGVLGMESTEYLGLRARSTFLVVCVERWSKDRKPGDHGFHNVGVLYGGVRVRVRLRVRGRVRVRGGGRVPEVRGVCVGA